MRILPWNVRGCNKPFKQKEVKLFLKINKIDVAMLLETRVKKEKYQKVKEKMCRGWDSAHNYDSAVNGRIWLCWKPTVASVRVIEEHEQAIHYELLDMQTGLSQQVIAVYALNNIEQRKQLWTFIRRKSGNNSRPLLAGGDFNTVLCAGDRLQGQPVTAAEIKDFAECLQDSELKEIRAVGSEFTWYNNQEGEDKIHSNIDRCVANVHWFNCFSHIVVERMDKCVSDHCSQILCYDHETNYRKPPFKFLNVLAEHPQFEQMVRRE